MNRSQVVMLIVVLGLATFYAWSKLDRLETSNQEYQEARYFPNLEEADVERIKVVSAEPKFEYELVQKGDRWYIDANLLSLENSHQLISSILELSREREMDSAPTAEREAEFQTHEPAFQVTIWGKDNKELGSVKLGKRTPDFNHFYGQRGDGGPISTVPAYTLSTLEEEPKELLETSLFPIEVAALQNLTVRKDDAVLLSLERSEDDKDSYIFVEPELGKADEDRLKSFLFQLRDLKVGRFLGPDENAPVGNTEVLYEAKLSYSDFLQVTELKQRVAANPKLVYGKRYLLDSESGAAVDGTTERFVVEVAVEGEVANPTVQMFEDRRVAVFDLDKVRGLLVGNEGKSVEAKRSDQGKWGGETSELPQEALSNLLWVLKDLRYESSLEGAEEPGDDDIIIRLSIESQPDLILRFSRPQTGKPYLWRQSDAFSLSDSSWETISGSVSKILKTSNESKALDE